MTVSNPLQNFGICQITMKDLNDPSIMGIGKILGDITPDLNQELIENRGGCSAFPWDVAPGEATAEVSVVIKQYDKNILRFLNAWKSDSLVEDADGEADGSVTPLTNQTGTSMQNATTGIASIAVDTATKTNLAYGDYVIKALDASTFDVYLNTDISGTAKYVDDTYKINDAPITNPGTGGTVVFQGVEFTAGSGASSFTTGDMATFSVKPPSTYLLENYLMRNGASQQYFELLIVGEKLGDKIRTIKFPRCIAGGGGNLKFVYKDWSMIETTIKILQPANYDWVAKQDFINR